MALGPAQPVITDLLTGSPGSDLNGHTPDTFSPPTPIPKWVIDPAWVTDGGRIQFDSATGVGVTSTSSAFTHYELQNATQFRPQAVLTILSAVGQAGLTLQDSGGNNFFWGYYDAALNTWNISQGTTTILASTPATGLLPAVMGQSYTLSLSYAHGLLQLTVNGVVACAIVSNALTATQGLGLGMSGASNVANTGLRLTVYQTTPASMVETTPDGILRSIETLLVASQIPMSPTSGGKPFGPNAVFMSLNPQPFPQTIDAIAISPGGQDFDQRQIAGAGRWLNGITGLFTTNCIFRRVADVMNQDTIALSADAGNLYSIASSILGIMSTRLIYDGLANAICQEPPRPLSIGPPTPYTNQAQSSAVYRSVSITWEVKYTLSLTVRGGE